MGDNPLRRRGPPLDLHGPFAQLAQALGSRDLIGQAKGILMERYKIGPERAFLVLTRVSQTSNRKLHDIATELVRHGTVPGIPAPPTPS